MYNGHYENKNLKNKLLILKSKLQGLEDVVDSKAVSELGHSSSPSSSQCSPHQHEFAKSANIISFPNESDDNNIVNDNYNNTHRGNSHIYNRGSVNTNESGAANNSISSSMNIHYSAKIRKMKLEESREQRQKQEDIELTFKPKINRRCIAEINDATRSNSTCDVQATNNDPQKKSSSFQTLPVHERLFRKGQEYAAAHNARRVQSKLYDEFGQRMFQPRISNQYNSASVPFPYFFPATGVRNSDDIGNDNRQYDKIYDDSDDDDDSIMGVDEYLYKDAQDRQLRQRGRDDDYQQQLRHHMTSSKLNYRSAEILYQKADRTARLIFQALDLNECGAVSADDILHYLHMLAGNSGNHSTGKYNVNFIHDIASHIWSELTLSSRSLYNSDNRTSAVPELNKLSVDLSSFLITCCPLLAMLSAVNNNHNMHYLAHKTDKILNNNHSDSCMSMFRWQIYRDKRHHMNSASGSISRGFADQYFMDDGGDNDSSNRSYSSSSSYHCYSRSLRQSKGLPRKGQRALSDFLRHMSELVYADRYSHASTASFSRPNDPSLLYHQVILEKVEVDSHSDGANNNRVQKSNDRSELFTKQQDTNHSDDDRLFDSILQLEQQRQQQPVQKINENSGNVNKIATTHTQRLAAKQEERDRMVEDEGDDHNGNDPCSRHSEPSMNISTATLSLLAGNDSSFRERVSQLTSTDLLHARATVMAHRRNELRDRLLSQEQSDCTFTPRISARAIQQQQRKLLDKASAGHNADGIKANCKSRRSNTKNMTATNGLDADGIADKDKSSTSSFNNIPGAIRENPDENSNCDEDDSESSNSNHDDCNVFDRLHRLAREKQQQIVAHRQQIQERVDLELTAEIATFSSSSSSQSFFRPQLHESFAHTTLPHFSTSSNSHTSMKDNIKKGNGANDDNETNDTTKVSKTNCDVDTDSAVLSTAPIANSTVHDIKSVSSFLQRLEQGRINALSHQQRVEAVYHFDEATYRQSRVTALRGVVPFRFSDADRRRRRRQQLGTQHKLSSSTTEIEFTDRDCDDIITKRTSYANTSALSSSDNNGSNLNLNLNGPTLSSQYTESQEQRLLLIDVKLGPNCVRHLSVRDGESPKKVATAFCVTHSLDPSACALLTELVKRNMACNNMTMKTK